MNFQEARAYVVHRMRDPGAVELHHSIECIPVLRMGSIKYIPLLGATILQLYVSHKKILNL